MEKLSNGSRLINFEPVFVAILDVTTNLISLLPAALLRNFTYLYVPLPTFTYLYVSLYNLSNYRTKARLLTFGLALSLDNCLLQSYL